jgi:hypothetical protein
MKKIVLVCGLMAVSIAVQADVLFSDSFDRLDNADVNFNSAANQGGTVDPLNYSSFSNNTATSSSISGNKALVSVDGSGQARLVPQYDFSDQSSAIVSAGGFEVSYTVDSGVDYVGSVHGNYSSSLILSSDGIVQNAGAGAGNPWHGLYVTIKGNGQVQVYSQGANLLSKDNADYGSAFVTGQANDVRLFVASDGFLTDSANAFSLYINDTLVGSDSFNWKTSSNLSIGLEAGNYSAEFDNLSIKTIPEPATLGLVGAAGLIAVFIRRRLMM